VFKSGSRLRVCARSWSLVIVKGRSWSGLAIARMTGGSTSTIAHGSRVQGRAVQEPQQVLREGFRVHDVGDVLLSGQYQPLYIGVVVTAGG
jgi:hypothetical protein